MDDYKRPAPMPEDIFTPFGYVYQAYVLLATEDTGI